MPKSKIVLMVGVVVAVLLLVLCGAMVGRQLTQLAKNQNSLKGLKGQVEQACKKEPYPSPENVGVQHQNVEQIQAKLDDMMALLRHSNLEPEGKGTGFNDRLAKLRKELLTMAETSGTRVPVGFAFGFDRWVGGAIPKPAQLDELNRHLAVAEVLCRILLEEGCLELAKVGRDEVADPVEPVADDAEAAPADEPAIEEDPGTSRFDRIRVSVEFVAREQQFINILNRLASDPMFLVVSSVAMTKDVADVRMPAPPSDGEGGAAADVSKSTEKIMVSGTSVDGGMRLTLVVDAYRFPGGEPESAEAASTEANPEEER